VIEQLAQRIRDAAQTRTPLRIRGAGSKDFYAESLTGDLLDVSNYRGIVDYEPTELVMTARAGTPIADIEAALAEHHQLLCFEPPRFAGQGTLGGAIAAGLSGPRRPYAGAARDLVLGMRVLDGRGKNLVFGGQVIKNVAGFDVSRLLVGSMGTLAVLLEISLKTLPRSPMDRTLRFAMSEQEALHSMNQWAGKPLPISATCYTDGALTVRLSGAQAAVRAARQRLGGEALDQAQEFWDGIRDQSATFFTDTTTLWRVSLPSTAPPLGLAQRQLVEWGGALRWIGGDLDASKLRESVVLLGGHATLFRTTTKSAPVFHPLAPALAAIHRKLKAAMDPQGIFNPGRMYPDL
jgi:glycolate oxidase FAD binding subunit